MPIVRLENGFECKWESGIERHWREEAEWTAEVLAQPLGFYAHYTESEDFGDN